MTGKNAVDVVLEAFAAVESRDHQSLAGISHPGVEFIWPPSLQPSHLCLRGGRSARTFEAVWDPFQPTQRERQMSPRVVAASDEEVAVMWRQRGVNAKGERIDCEVFGLYEVRDGLLARAQMFYFDAVAVKRFLEEK